MEINTSDGRVSPGERPSPGAATFISGPASEYFDAPTLSRLLFLYGSGSAALRLSRLRLNLHSIIGFDSGCAESLRLSVK
jgi:hypothetical protein